MFRKRKFEKLLSPFQIKQIILQNRMVKTGAAMGFASEDGYVTETNLGFYEAIAKGGVGLIIVEHGFVDYPMGVTGLRRIAISHDKFIPGVSKLTQAIHRHDTPCFIQLGHSGSTQRWLLAPGQLPVSSSSLGDSGPRELSIAEIEELVKKYAKAAERAKEAGFDGVEIHAAHPYLLNSFLSRFWNRRTDAYGCQDLKGRARFLVEILQAIRGLVGKNFIVGVRINGAEYGMENGITLEDSQGFAIMLQEASADFINVSAWGSGPYEWLVFPEQILYPEPTVPLARQVRKPGVLVHLAEAIKKVVTIPVIAVGRLDATLGEWILEKKKADLIGLNRRLLADPEYPNKVASAKLEDIAPCTACLDCMTRGLAGERVQCRINAALGREHEFIVKPAERKKRVVIVGGGPAGMEAARLSALRGHEVILYEREHRLGGLLPLAALIRGTEIEDIPAIVSYLKRQISKLGVQVKLRTEVNTAVIKEINPDVVVIASGGTLTTPEIPGIKRRNVTSSIDLHKAIQPYLRFFGPKVIRWLSRFYLPFGKTVIIIGGLMHGCEIAEFLVKRGRKVTVAETSDQLGSGISEMKRGRLLSWLTKKGALLLTEVKSEAITDRGLIIITKEGERRIIEADTVSMATPPVPNTELFDALKGKVNELYLIGDAKEPDTILNAINDGSQIGRII